MKTVLCAIAKNENRYIRDWVEHYKKLGFTNIILYDNNDVDGEKFDTVIGDYIKNGFVILKDYRGRHKSFTQSYAKATLNHGVQQQAYQECYNNYANDYDWFCFFDIDEYLWIDKPTVSEFLYQRKFSNADVIQLNWKCYGDSGLLRYDNKPVAERFTKASRIQPEHVKTMIRSGFKDVLIPCHYAEVKDGRYVYANGKPTRCGFKQKISLENAYLKHYVTKTIEEWCGRKFGATSATGKDYFNTNIRGRINEFFTYNTKTVDKERIANSMAEEFKKKDTDKVIVSMTSFKERISSAEKVFNIIKKGTMKPFKMVLTLHKDDVNYITKGLQKMIDEKDVELIVCNDNLKPHTKYFYTMLKYRQYPIITIDDDIKYTDDLVESLYKSYKNHPDCISARRVHKMTSLGNGKLASYKKWIMSTTRYTEPRTDLFPTGVGGVLYPPNILDINEGMLPDIKKCLNADDIYLKYLEQNKGIKTVWAKNRKPHGNGNVEGSQKITLQSTNVKKNGNDEYLKIFDLSKSLEKKPSKTLESKFPSRFGGGTEIKKKPKFAPNVRKNNAKPEPSDMSIRERIMMKRANRKTRRMETSKKQNSPKFNVSSAFGNI